MRFRFWTRPVCVGDVESINHRKCYSKEEIEQAVDLEKYSANALLAHGKLMTRKIGIVLPDGREAALGVFGAVKQWDGFATAWFIFDENVEKYPVAASKAVRAFMLVCKNTLGLRRISFTVRTDYTVGQRFAEFFGFKVEGHLKCYLPDGADVYLYARVFE